MTLESQAAGGGLLALAADILERYAEFILTVKADDLELHPYRPQVEETAAELRALRAANHVAPQLLEAGKRLIAVSDQLKMTNAARIIAGISDAGLRTEGNAALDALRAAIQLAEGR